MFLFVSVRCLVWPYVLSSLFSLHSVLFLSLFFFLSLSVSLAPSASLSSSDHVRDSNVRDGTSS